MNIPKLHLKKETINWKIVILALLLFVLIIFFLGKLLISIVNYFINSNVENEVSSYYDDTFDSNSINISENTDESVSLNELLSENTSNSTDTLENIINIEDTSFVFDTTSLENQLISYIGKKNISVSYFNLTYNNGFDINGDVEYHPASTAKLFVVLGLYDACENGTLDINDSIVYTSSDYEEGTGILQTQGSVGKKYSLETLGKYAIVYSDNVAFKMLRRTLGNHNVLNYCTEQFGHSVGSSVYNIKMSSNDAEKLLIKLYQNEEDNYLYDEMIENMKNTIFDNRLSQYLPDGIVAHKIGDYSSYAHDAGIVFADSPYVVTVYTKGDTNAYNDIAQISKMIYEWNQTNDNI